VQARLLAWEEVEVTAGRFEVARVERMLELAHPDATRTHTRRKDVLWLAPQVGRWVARETSGHYVVPSGDNRGADVYLEDHFRWELTDWDRG
jgi:hypothetical protein